MRSHFLVECAALAGLFGCATSADAGTPSPFSSVADAKAAADQLIAAAQVGDVFENITNSNTPVVRHKASGMNCAFNGTAGERLAIFPSAQPRGEDVGCSFQLNGVTVSLDAVHLPGATLDEAFNDYWNAMPRLHPGAKPYVIPGPHTELRGPNLPEIRSASFTYELNAAPVFSRLAVAVVNGWVIEERTTTALPNARFADIFAQSVMAIGILPMVTATR